MSLIPFAPFRVSDFRFQIFGLQRSDFDIGRWTFSVFCHSRSILNLSTSSSAFSFQFFGIPGIVKEIALSSAARVFACSAESSTAGGRTVRHT